MRRVIKPTKRTLRCHGGGVRSKRVVCPSRSTGGLSNDQDVQGVLQEALAVPDTVLEQQHIRAAEEPCTGQSQGTLLPFYLLIGF